MGIGGIMMSAMGVMAQALAAEEYKEPPEEEDAGLTTIDEMKQVKPGPNWKETGSHWVGKKLQRAIYRETEGASAPNPTDPSTLGEYLEVAEVVVEWWMPTETSEFKDAAGAQAPLWRVRYLTGELKGDVEDLEEFELHQSLRPEEAEEIKKLIAKADADAAAAKAAASSSASAADTGVKVEEAKGDGEGSGGGGGGGGEGEGGGGGGEPMDDTFSSQDVPDHRIVAMTTVYLDEKAQRFYQRSGMDTELPPYAANKRRGHERAAPPRIWDNDNKRLYVYWYGSELKAIRMGFNFAMPGEDITESPRCKLRAKVTRARSWLRRPTPCMPSDVAHARPRPRLPHSPPHL